MFSLHGEELSRNKERKPTFHFARSILRAFLSGSTFSSAVPSLPTSFREDNGECFPKDLEEQQDGQELHRLSDTVITPLSQGYIIIIIVTSSKNDEDARKRESLERKVVALLWKKPSELLYLGWMITE